MKNKLLTGLEQAKKLVKEISQNNKISVSWNKDLAPGVYKLYLVVKNQSDNLITTPSIIVNLQ